MLSFFIFIIVFYLLFSSTRELYKPIHIGHFDTELEAFMVYKNEKEAYIIETVTKWKDQIDPRVYEALMNYQVEITD